jgi:osmoprotectant transport system ATP-binding protein
MTVPDNGVAVDVANVSKRHGNVEALVDVSLTVASGECLALVGESGSGKTTLLRCINRLIDADAGAIRVNGRDTLSLHPVTLRRSIGYVPQDGGILPHWSVARNVGLVPWRCEMPDSAARVSRALRVVGFDDSIGTRWPHQLSGGQRQRVAIARALAADQRLLLLDEPFGALDAITRSELQQQLKDIREATRPTTILVTHDLREALFLADRIAVLRGGRLEQVATGTTLREHPATEYVARLLAHSDLVS